MKLKKGNEEILELSFIEEYNKVIRFFYDELVNLHVNYFIINKVKNFRFDYFTPNNDNIFFYMVMNNFIENSLICIARLVCDMGKDTISLQKFKNIIYNHIKSEYKNAFKEKIKSVKFDNEVGEIIDKIKKLRNNRLAHSIMEAVFDPSNISKISYIELERVIEKCVLLFNSLIFEDTEYAMYPIPYLDNVTYPKNVDPRTDIEKILDNIVKDSQIFNMPEENLQLWLEIKKMEPPEKINILNEYRIKFNMDKV